jgi:hypothetical protein
LGARAASGAGASPADRGALGVIVMLGLFLSNYSSDRAREYWIAMFPVFGVTCLVQELATGRAHASRYGESCYVKRFTGSAQ